MTNSPRECGACAACCTLLAVDGHKPAQQVCPDQSPRGSAAGCTRYDTRPQPCRDYRCAWLEGLGDDSWRPDRINLIFDGAASDEDTARLDADKLPWLIVRERWPGARHGRAAAKILRILEPVTRLVYA